MERLVVIKVVVVLATCVVMPRKAVQNGSAWFALRMPIAESTLTAWQKSEASVTSRKANKYLVYAFQAKG